MWKGDGGLFRGERPPLPSFSFSRFFGNGKRACNRQVRAPEESGVSVCERYDMKNKKTQKQSNILRFYSFTKGFRAKFLISVLMVVVAVIANYMTPQVIRVTVDSVINDNPFNLPGFMSS